MSDPTNREILQSIQVLQDQVSKTQDQLADKIEQDRHLIALEAQRTAAASRNSKAHLNASLAELHQARTEDQRSAGRSGKLTAVATGVLLGLTLLSAMDSADIHRELARPVPVGAQLQGGSLDRANRVLGGIERSHNASVRLSLAPGSSSDADLVLVSRNHDMAAAGGRRVVPWDGRYVGIHADSTDALAKELRRLNDPRRAADIRVYDADTKQNVTLSAYDFQAIGRNVEAGRSHGHEFSE